MYSSIALRSGMDSEYTLPLGSLYPGSRGRCKRLRRSWEMKLPDEPESTRAEAVTDWTRENS